MRSHFLTAFRWGVKAFQTSSNGVQIRLRCGAASCNTDTGTSIPNQARVVVCGGGIAGISLSYHLAKAGWTDVVLLEQGKLTCGTTWHSVGLVGLNDSVEFVANCRKISSNLYESLEEETGMSSGFLRNGSIAVAQTNDRMTALKRSASMLRAKGEEFQFVTPSEIASLAPYIKVDDLVGGVYHPRDGRTNISDTAAALASAAKKRGVKIIEGVEVEKVLTKNHRVTGVETNNGIVNCEYFVNAAGQWSRDVGLKSSPQVRVPLHSAEHYYIITKAVKEVSPSMPYVRDYDGRIYIVEWSQGLLCGCFEAKAKPIFSKGIPTPFMFESLPPDWDQFQPALDSFLLRVPSAETVEVQQLFNGPESFTPDGKFLLGESPEVGNYFVMTGFNSGGAAVSGGAGSVLADWIVSGKAPNNILAVDIRRFTDCHNNQLFLRDRVKEVVGRQFALNYPGDDFKYGRNQRCSPLYVRQQEAGAVFGESMGYERPKYYLDKDEFLTGDQKGTFGKPVWFDKVKAEYWTCRDSVSLMDMSTFAKFELKSEGSEATEFLQRLCPNEMDVDVGTLVHTPMLDENGHFQNDCSVARMEENSYFIISPTPQETRAFHWISKHLPDNGSVHLHNVTNQYSGINVIGPKARELLQTLTLESLNTTDFRPFCCKNISIGYANNVKAMSITHVGEPGFVLYLPNEEIDFIGKSALIEQKAKGVESKLAMFLLEDHDLDNDLWPWGGEPIYRDSKFTGMSTSSGYAPTLGKMVVIGWVTNRNEKTGQRDIVTNDFVSKGHYEIELSGKRFRARGSPYPMKLQLKQPQFG
ncbi:pyruvate dehydrogenase phosphatase regulatory subunit, mitochondrial-like isoform X2 [Anneissia japonica]|uniref:pyruvate dehydrogenase phosphatase regulatory subunit, mitochondrial-like isoform X2 n=1 Tax=Anneissia japonica TaxID=1529436 RepID=UPI001425A19D|nr:pyruvate dehydrogenase phosphatase regulatory subunit, mitochondrial-like isoform X2 [Anneissia japonica]